MSNKQTFSCGKTGKERHVLRSLRLARRGIGVAVPVLLSLGGSGAFAQTYTYNPNSPNTAGVFSTGFGLTTASDGAGSTTLQFGGAAYTATDDFTNTYDVNSLRFTNTGAVTLARGGAGKANQLRFLGDTPTISLGNTGSLQVALDVLLNGTTTVSGIGSATLSGAITGVGGLIKNGTGTLTLSNLNNSFTGNLAINQGTLIAAAAQVSTTPSASVLGNPSTAGRTITVGSSNGATTGTLQFVASRVFGTGNSNPAVGLVINNGSTVTNSGGQFNILPNVTLNGGTLTGTGGLSASEQMYAFAFGKVTVGGNTMSTISGSGPNSGYHLGGETTFDVAKTGTSGNPDLLVSGSLIDNFSNNGAGSLLKIGGGTMTLTGTNSYTGSTTINGGTLNVGNASASSRLGSGTGEVTINGGATLGFYGTSGAGTAVINNNNSYLYFFNSASAGSAVINNPGGNGSIYFSDTSGAGSATITNSGSLGFGDNSSAGSATITSSKGFVSFDERSSAGSATITSSFDSSLNFYGSSSAGSSTITSNGSLSFLGSASAGSATITSNNGYMSFLGSSSAGNATINSIGGGSFYFQDTSSAGSATINNSSFLFFNGDSTAGSATIVNGDNGSITLYGHNGGLSIGRLSGSGSVYLGNQTLTVGGAAASVTSDTFSGLIGSGSLLVGGSLIKAGAGTLTLTGTNLYTEGTTITGGTLSIGSEDNVGTGAVTLNGGLLQWTGGDATFGRTVILGSATSGSGFDISGTSRLTVASALMGTGSLTKTGSGVLILTGANTYSGATTVTGGTLQVGNSAGSSSLGNGTGAVTIGGNSTLIFDNSSSAGSAAITNNGSLNFVGLSSAGSATITNGANGTVSLADHQGGLSIESLGGSGTVSLGGNTLTLGANNANSSFSGVITGSGSLAKVGTGTLALAGASTYSGGTNVSGGTLAVGNAGALGTGTVTINGGTLGATSAVTISNAVSLGGSAGLSSGTFATGSLHTPGLVLAGPVTLDSSNFATAVSVTGASRVGVTGVIGEANGAPTVLIKTGAGTLELGNDNTYTGGTLVSQGTLIVNNAYNRTATGSGTGEGAVTVARGATLTGQYRIDGAVQVNSGGTLAVGNSIGQSQVASLSLTGGSLMDFEIGSDGVSSDRLNILGLLSKSGTNSLPITFALSGELFSDGSRGALSEGAFTLLTYNSQSGFQSSDFVATGLSSDWTSAFTLTSGTGNGPGALVVTLRQNAVGVAAPEPGSLFLLMVVAGFSGPFALVSRIVRKKSVP